MNHSKQGSGPWVYDRLFNEHALHQKRRSSIYDPEKKEKDEERELCTFQPSLEKSNKYFRIGA